jgi:hypothetical protein
MMERMTEMTFQIGQTVTWIGTKHLFERKVTITAIRKAMLSDDTIYDIHDDEVIKGTIFSIPETQLIENE